MKQVKKVHDVSIKLDNYLKKSILIQNNRPTRDMVLQLFFENPAGTLYPQEVARRLGVHPTTAATILKQLQSEGLVLLKPTKLITEANANLENPHFRYEKRTANIAALYRSGIVDLLNDIYAPDAIILFGSFARGEDTAKSDIDLAVLTKRHLDFDLRTFEKVLGKKIDLFEVNLGTLQKDLKTNLLNGVILEGYVDV